MPPKRKIKIRRKVHAKPLTSRQMLDRMADILAHGHGTEEDAKRYYELEANYQVFCLQSIISRAQEERSWDFMEGAYAQAMTLYVFASTIYEQFPEETIMSDGAFDALARWMLANFDKLPSDFKEWYVVTSMDLSASTGMNVRPSNMVRWMVKAQVGQFPAGEHNAKNETASLRQTAIARVSNGTGNTGKRSPRSAKTIKKLRRKPRRD